MAGTERGGPVSETEARRVAEEARETEWQAPPFLKEIFLGNFRLDRIHPFPEAPLEYSGRLILAEGRPREAFALFERALRVRRQTFRDEDHAEIAESLVDIAQVKARLEGPAAAEPILHQALAIQRKSSFETTAIWSRP